MVGGWIRGRHPCGDCLGVGMMKREGRARGTSEYFVDEAVTPASAES